MWNEGIITADSDTKYKFWAKVYEEGSEFGIDGGKVSKLTIRKVGESRDLCNYDCGLDVDCQSDEVRTVLNTILARFN